MLEIGTKVRFQLSDSPYTRTGVIEDVETYPATSVYDPEKHIYTVRQDGRNWVHRLYDKDLTVVTDNISPSQPYTDECPF